MKNIYNHLFWTGIIAVSLVTSFLILIGVNIYPYISDKLTKKNEITTHSEIKRNNDNIPVIPQTPEVVPKEIVIVKNPKPIQQVTKPVTVHDTVKIESVVKDTTSSKTP